jgi:hypothetical protein
MKLAILFFGISKFTDTDLGKAYHINKIDYTKSINNYQEYMFNYFLNKGYEIDIFFTTNMLDDNDKHELCNTYKPIKCNFLQNNIHNVISRNEKFLNVMELCMDTQYDLYLITRFDLMFQKDFNQSNLQLDKFNLVSILEQPNYICDNFYLFPHKYFDSFF